MIDEADISVVAADLRRLGKEDGWLCATAGADIIDQLRQQLAAAEAKLRREDESHSKTITDRDYYHEVADKLAQGIAEHFRVELCEHSSDECPWTMALEILNGEYVTDSDEKRQLAAAIAERERDANDAARYRWLRDDASDEWNVTRWLADGDTQEILFGDDLDAAVSAAIAAGGEGAGS